LRDLVQRLQARTPPGVVAVQRLAIGQGHVVEHQAVGQVAVVRDREQPVAGVALEVRRPGPEVLRIEGVEVAEGDDGVRRRLAAGEDDVAVAIVLARVRSTFEADPRRCARYPLGFKTRSRCFEPSDYLLGCRNIPMYSRADLE
jgi:hypothetical protein